MNSTSVRRFFANLRWREVALAVGLALSVFAPAIVAQAVQSPNLVVDPGFEAGISDFSAQDGYATVERSTESPIEGAASLHVAAAGWGTTVWWSKDFTGGLASRLQIAAHLRSDLESASILNFCAIVYFTDWSTDEVCTPVSGSAGDKGIVSANLPIDSARPLMWVNIRMYQEGSDALSFMVDEAFASLAVVQEPPPPTSGGGGSDPGNGGGSGDPGDSGGSGSTDQCAVSENSVYPGFAYQLPTTRPFISLSSYSQAAPTSTPYQRMQAAADLALAGDPPYAYSATHSVIVHALTGQQVYLDDAIARVEAFVTEAEADIANGNRPAISGDSYLDVGWFLEQLALAYDHGYGVLTPDQRLRWTAFAEQSLFNLWHPNEAKWGDVSYPWSGWSICDPGNNYHFSFLRATMLWALASQNQAWFDFLQQQKFKPLLDYYAALPGGGTREGTGYGTALGNLFGNYILWKDSTGEDLAGITPHPRETIDYWVHATVPTLDRFAPIADLSRQSIPEIYDYQESLVHELVVLSPGTPEAKRGTWWLQNNSVKQIAHTFSLASDLLPYPDPPVAPTALMYHSPGAGALFARTSWDSVATWIAFIAGKYDQSHAHQDQGSFTFFKNDWLAVTNNIWSQSGLHQEVEAHNTLRFERADGSVISQNQSSTHASTMTPVNAGGITIVNADLTNAYSANPASIQSWTRTLELSGDVLRVTDACTVAPGIRPIFQLQVPSASVMQPDGTIRAGHLLVTLMQPATASFLAMNAAEFQRGYRIDLTTASGCSFDVLLQAMPDAPTEDPGGGQGPGLGDDPPPPLPAGTPSPTPPPTCLDCSADPVEAIWGELGPSATRIKSPAPHMHFTAGAPFRILADARDVNAWMCPPGHPPYVCPGTQERFSVDGQLVAIATPSATDMNLWEARLPNGLAAGDHVLTVAYVPYNPSTGSGGSPIGGLAPITVHVDPAPVHGTTIALTGDLVLSGSTDLNWTDATIVGNGFTVTAAPGYFGNIVVQGSFVTGLGNYSTPGIDVTTSGSASIEGSIFEATGGMRVSVQSGGSITVRNNELRANNRITYVASNPAVPVALELVGNTSGAKVVQGNRVGAGILRIRGGSDWQIGGLAAGEGNVLIGPRAVLELVDSSNDAVQGNYRRHDYHGGFSQGFNLVMSGSADHALIEHNVIRGGSWPVQSIGGEFRYNLVIDSGHNFWRSASDHTQVHHNVFANASAANTGYEGAVKVYGGESGLRVYNNTFDAGGTVGAFDSPAFNIGPGSLFESIRNNLFTGFSTVTGYGGAFVGAPEGSVSAPRVTGADYNAWHNPLAPSSPRYLSGIVADTPGAHDVQADPQLSGPAEIPYRMSEGCIWLGNCTTGQVLAHYREIYRPAAGSPLINAGDPADGAGTPIGAIGPDDSHPVDRFGRIAQ